MRTHLLQPLLSILLLTLLCPTLLYAEAEKKPAAKPQGPPPMLVEVTEITQGAAEPMVELVGTIRYARVSRVAAEVAGTPAGISSCLSGR